MSEINRPVVPLEAGVSEENPPCPACGEPLFGWALIRPNATPVRRCERCGMAVAGAKAPGEEARTALRAVAESGQPLANRRSLQAWIGSSGWAALEPGSRFMFTPEAAKLLGFSTSRSRFDLFGMWQTLVNAFTFGHNLAVSKCGEKKGTPADQDWQRALDWVITAVTAVPLLAVSLLLEGFATVFGRGGEFRIALSDRPT